MSIIFTIFLILCGSAFFATIFNKRIEETIIFDILSTIILVYLFGLLGLLKYGVYTFIIISIILGFAEIILFIKSSNKCEFIKSIITPGLLLFFILNIVLIYFERGRMFSDWDEFSHWGSAIKSMFTINDFSTNQNSTLMFKSYPPAMTIFQYIFQFIKGQFIEYYAYYSYSLFVFSLLLPFTSNLRWKNISKIFICLILIIVTPIFIYTNFYNSIYIDAALGLTFGFIVSKILCTKENYKIYDIILICSSFFVLILEKDTGLFLALIALVIFTIDILKYKNNLKKLNKTQIIKKLGICVLPLICIIIAKFTWSYLININNAEKMFSNSYNFIGIIKLIIGKDTTYRSIVVENFINGCFDKKILEGIVSVNTIELGIIFAIVFLLISKICSCNKRENCFLIIVIVGLILYLFGLMITYAYKFPEVEAIEIASFVRYVKIYYAGLMFITYAIFINYKEMDNKTILIYTLIVMLFSPISTIYNLHKSISTSINYRSNFLSEVEKIKNNIDDGKSLFFIDKIDTEEEGVPGKVYWVERYSLIPVEFNDHGSWNITTDLSKVNRFCHYMSFEEFKNQVFNQYDYIYIRHLNEDFKTEYGVLFEDLKANSLYKVDNNKLIKIY